MPTQTKKLVDRIERSHKSILEQIDRLDRQITEVLQSWTQWDSAGFDVPRGDPSAADAPPDRQQETNNNESPGSIGSA
ncbi:MAG: hypothetical protein J6S27_05510 [Thermoguttaceae bacterium]|nr:hypothetical protein [Thermoguttaceae bacterium]